MKRMLAALLVLLLLTGCTVVNPGDTKPVGETTVSTEPTVPGIYDSASAVESATAGAVRQYQVDRDCYAVAVVGGNVVLFSSGALRAYTGDDLRMVKEVSVQTVEFPQYPDVQVTTEALGYYDEVDHAVVMLNGNLKELARVNLPEELQGGFVLADTLDTLYYCTADAIRGYNLKNGTSRLLRQQTYDAQLLTQNCFGGDILGCEIYTRDRQYVAYISAETGELLGSSHASSGLVTGGDYYYAEVFCGETTEYLFGRMGETAQCFHPDGEGTIHPALEMGGVFVEQRQDANLILDYYDLSTGEKTATVTLPNVPGTVLESWADAAGGCLWLLVGEDAGAEGLYCWTLAQSPSGDTAVYTAPRYTAQNPDQAGLAACAAAADALGQKYGITVSLGEAPEGCELQLKAEYRVDRIQAGLEALETALERYPQQMRAVISAPAASGKLHLILTGEISGDRTAYQYWSGNDACVVLELGDHLVAAVDNGLYHVLDTFLFNNTSKLDQWAELNPKGFDYAISTTAPVYQIEQAFLTGEKRAFVDSLSMSYPMEDRAAIFAAAMGSGNEEIFAAATMQKKLLTLCQAIRDAFDWKKSEESYLWEQYLTESIAYQPKI